MKIISVKTDLTLDGMTRIYSELRDKKAEKGDLIQKDKNNLGVILIKHDGSIYMGSFNKEENILITEFNIGTFAQSHSVKGSKTYSAYRNIIETAYKEATK